MKSIAAVFSLCTICLLAVSCKRELIADAGQYTRIYMPQAVAYPVIQNLVMTDTLQTLSFGAAFGGVEAQSNTIALHFAIKDALVDSFNKANNTTYLPLPAAAWQAAKLDAVIEKGSVNTPLLQLKVKTIGGIEPLKEYLLPVTIASVDPALPVNEKLRTTYFLIKGTYVEFGRTAWKVTVSSQEAPNIGTNAFDGSTTTQWHTQWKAAQPPHPHIATVDMTEVKNIHGFYFWPSANVTTGNPQDIHIDVSMDGTNWTNAGDYSFANVYDKKMVYLASPVQAQYFKVTVKSSFGNTHFTHIAEIGSF